MRPRKKYKSSRALKTAAKSKEIIDKPGNYYYTTSLCVYLVDTRELISLQYYSHSKR